ncbi:MAG TPA: anti-sigma regulatory factor [Stellaceae bacterium]
MTTAKTERLDLRSSEDVIRVRQHTRVLAIEAGLSLVDQTKIVTAASEIARNTVIHGGGGMVTVSLRDEGSRKGVRLVFEDKGPGIADIEQALRDGFSSGDGLGLGLAAPGGCRTNSRSPRPPAWGRK